MFRFWIYFSSSIFCELGGEDSCRDRNIEAARLDRWTEGNRKDIIIIERTHFKAHTVWWSKDALYFFRQLPHLVHDAWFRTSLYNFPLARVWLWRIMKPMHLSSFSVQHYSYSLADEPCCHRNQKPASPPSMISNSPWSSEPPTSHLIKYRIQ